MKYEKFIQSRLKNPGNPEIFWKKMIDKSRSVIKSKNIEYISNQDIKKQAIKLSDKISRVIRNEPIGKSIRAVYFGLYDKENSNGDPVQGFSISGTDKTDDGNGDFLCLPKWKPKNGNLKSKILDDIIQAREGYDLTEKTKLIGENVTRILTDDEAKDLIQKTIQEFKGKDDNEEHETYGYLLAMGAAITLVKMVSEMIQFGKSKIYVGFDSGDYYKI